MSIKWDGMIRNVLVLNAHSSVKEGMFVKLFKSFQSNTCEIEIHNELECCVKVGQATWIRFITIKCTHIMGLKITISLCFNSSH